MAALGKTLDLYARLERAPNTLNEVPLNGEVIVHELQANPARSFRSRLSPTLPRRTRAISSRTASARPADVEMARVLKTAPVSMASDPSSGAIAHWKHERAA